MDTYWLCDTCGEKINSPDQGLIEWYSCKDGDGVRRSRNLRLVHEISASPLKKLKRKGCAFDTLQGLIMPEGEIGNNPLSKYLGPDGLMFLLSLLTEGKFPNAEVLKMIKRLHIPGYELARDYFRMAISEGVLKPGTPEGYYDQNDINAVLKWLQERRR